jgi:prevent-host-death family protein
VEESTVQASSFKARCQSLLDEVARTRTRIVVTKHGKPAARLVPMDDEPMPMESRGVPRADAVLLDTHALLWW